MVFLYNIFFLFSCLGISTNVLVLRLIFLLKFILYRFLVLQLIVFLSNIYFVSCLGIGITTNVLVLRLIFLLTFILYRFLVLQLIVFLSNIYFCFRVLVLQLMSWYYD